MTRGKRGEQHEEPDYGELVSSSDRQGRAEASKPNKLEELTSLVKSLVRTQTSRDEQMGKEFAHQEQRWKSIIQHQFLEVQAQGRELKGEF